LRTGEKILIGGIVSLALGLGLYTILGPTSGKQVKLEADLKKLKAENQRLAEENHRLTLEVEALRNRQDYQEKVIRQELGLLKPNEILIQLPRKKQKTTKGVSKIPGGGSRPMGVK